VNTPDPTNTSEFARLLEMLIEDAQRMGRFDGMYRGGQMSEQDHRFFVSAWRSVQQCRTRLLERFEATVKLAKVYPGYSGSLPSPRRADDAPTTPIPTRKCSDSERGTFDPEPRTWE
jgi:hypothetical protein